jgi:hypothetical protein
MATPRTDPSRGGSGPSIDDVAAASEPKPRVGEPASGGRIAELQVAIGVAAIVAGIFAWWALQQGGYFDTTFLPGSIALYAVLILLLVAAPFRGRLGTPAVVALAALAALAAWTLLSLAWTESHNAALQDMEKAVLYGAVFGVGLWCCILAGRRWAMLPLGAIAVTGAFVGIVTTITLATGTDVPNYFHADATLRYPVGYRNAEAAFMLICLWPTVVLAAEGGLPWQLRALAIGAATMLLELAVLAESRGSLPAAAVALLVLVVLAPRRLRAATFLALAALPVLPALSTLLHVFQHGGDGPALIPLMRDSARAIALTSIGSVLLAAIMIRGVEVRLHLGPHRVRLISRAVAIAAALVVVVGGVAFVAKKGGPLKFVDQRVAEFNSGGDPNLQTQGTRFGVNIGSNRRDFWRVALDQWRDHPLAGGGAGSFADAYLLRRNSLEQPHDPHSVELLMLSELGVVGLLLVGGFLAAATIAALQSRRGAASAALSAAALTAGAYWLVHASYDWFWRYPAITAPVIFLLGAAAAPPLFDASARRPNRPRYLLSAAIALPLLIAVPLFFSQRYANRAYDEYPGNATAALDDLDRAADLNPYDPDPLLAKGLIESRLGHLGDAVSALRDAIDRQPDSYAGHYFLARVLARTDPAAARVEAREALRLNPLDLQTRVLNRSLQAGPQAR